MTTTTRSSPFCRHIPTGDIGRILGEEIGNPDMLRVQYWDGRKSEDRTDVEILAEWPDDAPFAPPPISIGEGT